MVVEPVLVTVELPRTAKLCAEPRSDAADPGAGAKRSVVNAATTKIIKNLHFILDDIRSSKVCLISLEIFLIAFSFLWMV
jgi:hypothetical protein